MPAFDPFRLQSRLILILNNAFSTLAKMVLSLSLDLLNNPRSQEKVRNSFNSHFKNKICLKFEVGPLRVRYDCLLGILWNS